MRCRDARQWLDAQRNGDLDSYKMQALHEHLTQCADCRAFEQRFQCMTSLFSTPPPFVQTTLSTERIMQAIQQQKRITQQLEYIQQQQQLRITRMRAVCSAMLALGLFTLSCIPLLILALLIIQTDVIVKIFYLLDGVFGTLIIAGQYIQTGLTLVTHNNWLLSGMAFAVVIMMGMWLRLMRPPQEA